MEKDCFDLWEVIVVELKCGIECILNSFKEIIFFHLFCIENTLESRKDSHCKFIRKSSDQLFQTSLI